MLVLKVTDVSYTHLVLTKYCCLENTRCLNVDDFGGKLFHNHKTKLSNNSSSLVYSSVVFDKKKKGKNSQQEFSLTRFMFRLSNVSHLITNFALLIEKINAYDIKLEHLDKKAMKYIKKLNLKLLKYQNTITYIQDILFKLYIINKHQYIGIDPIFAKRNKCPYVISGKEYFNTFIKPIRDMEFDPILRYNITTIGSDLRDIEIGLSIIHALLKNKKCILEIENI